MMLQKFTRKDKGFTLIELMIVIAIIGILAAIAIPNFIAYRKRSYNSSANSDIKNAYTAAQAYFTDNPTGSVDNGILTSTGYVPTQNVVLAIGNGQQSTLTMNAHHSEGDKTYYIDASGAITSGP